MKYEVLDSDKDLVKWKKTLSLLSDELQDIYFYPEYVGMYKFIKGTKSLLFTFKEEENIWLHPFLLQPIDSDAFSLNGGPWFDIESAYGYGGPLSNTEDKDFLDNANEQFSEWCMENNVVAEFVRFHPVIENEKWASEFHSIKQLRYTLSVKPEGREEHIYNNPKVRNMIKRTKKNNINVHKISIDQYFQSFVDVYHQNMERVNADKYYHFNTNYFSELKKLVNKNGYLVGAIKDEELIGASIFLFGKTNLHYHLSATGDQCDIPGVSNSLIDAGIHICRKNTMNLLHLGGGNSNSENDNLYKFKKSMGNMEHTYSIGWRIHHLDIYNQLKDICSSKFPASFEKHSDKMLFYRFIQSQQKYI